MNHLLHKIAFFSLSNSPAHSWLNLVRNLFQKYDLGDPCTLLFSPPDKVTYRRKVKISVVSFWLTHLSNQAKQMSSLKYLKCDFLPLAKGPHLIWRACNGSPSSVHASTIHAKLLCGTYCCDALLGKFSGGSVACSLDGCNA